MKINGYVVRVYSIPLLLIVAAAGVAPSIAPAQGVTAPAPPDLVAVAPNDRREVLPSSWLRRDTIVVQKGESIKSLLLSRSIYPGKNAYALIYEDNQQLQHVDSLSVGQKLILPVLPTETLEASRELSEHALVVALFHEDQKKATENTFRELATDAAGLRGTRSTAAASKVEKINQAVQTSVNDGPVTQQILSSLQTYSRVVDKIVDRSSAQGGVSIGDLKTINAVAKNVGVVSSCIQAYRQCVVQIEVHVFDNANTLQNGLEVYAAPYDLANLPDCLSDPFCAERFNTLSSPAKGELPAGTVYGVWAVKGESRVSDVKRVLVSRNSSSNRVELKLR